MKSRLSVVLAGVLGLLVLVTGGVALAWVYRPLSQPLAFNHRLHIEDAGMECTDCHLYVLTGSRATIPNIEVCVDCHEETSTESATEARLVEHVQAKTLIPWQKVNRVPDHVLFSHRRHAAIGKIECATCHGAVAERSTPVSRPAVDLSMDACQECHRQSGVSNDCLLCHR